MTRIFRRKIFVFLAVFVVLLSQILVSYAQTLSAPIIRASAAIAKSQMAKTIDEELTISLRYSEGNKATQDALILEQLLKNSYIKCRVMQDVSKNEANIDLALYIGNKKALSGRMYITGEYVIADFPQLYSKPIYMSVYSNITINGTSIDINKYINLFDFQNDKELQKLGMTYSSLLMPKISSYIKQSDKKVEITFSNGKKESLDEIVLKLDKKSSFDLLKVILNKASSDTQTKDYILKKAKQFLEYSNQTGDLEKMLNIDQNLSIEDINNLLSQIDTEYESLLKMLIDELDNQYSKIPPFTFQYSMMLDKDNNLKGERVYFYLKSDDNLKVMVDIKGAINSIGKPVNIPKIDKSKAIDSTKLTDADIEEINQKAENILNPFIAPYINSSNF